MSVSRLDDGGMELSDILVFFKVMVGSSQFGWVTRRWKLFAFAIALVVFLCMPNPESMIVRVVELAGLVLILARGLIGHYDDFLDLLEQRKRRR
jgi:UDP-N-acetylmuramyl pentapeptide phosphotransferase/UDP-N-acetylglucosamine-1-phosphate transferase